MTLGGKRAMALFLLAAVLLLAGRPASADNRKDAEKFFRAGEQAFNSSQYLMAAQAFEQAFENLALPSIAFSMAQAYRLQYFVDKDPKWLKRAVEIYRQYIGMQKSGGRRADAVANLAELEPILSRIEASNEIETLVIEKRTKLLVTSQVKGARASIGGGPLGPLPIETKAAGKHEIVVEADGYFPFREQREVFEGQFRVVEVALKPKPATVKVKAESGAAVSIDGRPAGVTPLRRPLEVAAGKHLIVVTRRGRLGYSREVSVERGETVAVDASLVTSGQRKAALWTGAASGTVFLAAGGFAIAAAVADGDASDILKSAGDNGGLRPDEFEQYNSKRDLRNTRLTTTYALLGVGTALATTSVLLYFLDTPSSGEGANRLMVVPAINSESQGAAVFARF